MPFRLPAGLIAIIVGTIVGFFAGASKIDFSGVAFHAPIPVLGDLITGIKLMFSYPAVLAAVLPIEIYNFIRKEGTSYNLFVKGNFEIFLFY
jgi:hypothetical protein